LITTYRKLYDILDTRERFLTLVVFIFALFVAIFEVVGVASIMPFMTVLSNPDLIDTNHYLNSAYEWFSFESKNSFIFFLGVVFLVFITVSLLLKALGFWIHLRFSQLRNYSWSARLVKDYLNQPYEWFLNQHSGKLGASVLEEVSRVVNGLLFPAIQLVSNALAVTFLMVLMIVADPLLAGLMVLILGSAYVIFFLTVSKYLRRIGKKSRDANRERFKIAQEGFGGFKEVKVGGLEDIFADRFRRSSLRFARYQINGKMLSELPSYVMQLIVFTGIMIVLLFLMASRGGLQNALPIFSLYAVAGYRLMPSLQSIYKNAAEIRYNIPVLDSLHADFSLMANKYDWLKDESSISIDKGQEKRLELKESLDINDIYYRYPGADAHALKGINIKIPARTTIGLVGSTGSGKTTLVDVILGLLPPERGKMLVDGKQVTPKLYKSWQRNIGYVPQHIFLTDDTISGNIAFGIPPEKINHYTVEWAARIANLHDFVTQELSHGYETVIGERGIRLSGGQRQRIGIARALYHNPDILIFDEATSALDNLTEHAVIKDIYNLSNQKTIILIAHRLTTVRKCDRIYFLENGHVISNGTYDEMVAKNVKFREMAGGI
jgi:ATP-binding cassette, subfamily B, bacterial PglK